jgi:hypothetical protein
MTARPRLLRWLGALCAVAAFQTAHAQPPPVVIDLRNEAARQATVQALTQRAVQAKQAAEVVARQGGWMIRDVDANGRVTELMQVANGLPFYYSTNNVNAAISTAANKIRNTAPYNVNGTGYIVGIWDGGAVRSNHQEFVGRVVVQDGASNIDHATHVAGTIGATGVNASARGMAPSISIDSYEWNSDVAEMTNRAATGPAQAGKIHISNHSYGYLTGWESGNYSGFNGLHFFGTNGDREDRKFGQYGGDAATWDSLHYSAPYYLAFKSAGNDRDDPAPSSGATYYYINGAFWASKSYNPATDPLADGGSGGYDTVDTTASAKNIMTIGAVNDAVSAGLRVPANGTMSTFSGWGPTDDGRIKPDIVANGISLFSSIATNHQSYASYSGTSMASPNAAGTALLLVDYYGRLFPGQAMRASTLKGLIIHTADDLGTAGPDYAYGWGLMNAEAAALQIKAHSDAPNSRFIREGLLSAGNPSESHVFTWNGTGAIRATLCWTDPAGTAKSGLDDRTAVLVNDLDVRITGPTTNLPFVLNVNSPSSPATTGDNIVDNVEQILIAAPTAGSYTVTVSYKGSLSGGQQYYSLILSGQSVPVTTPAPVLAAETATTPGTSNTISWSVVAPIDANPVEYYAESADNVNFTSPQSSGWIQQTQHTFNTLTPGQSYWYRVKARRSGVESAWSNVEQSQQELPIVTVAATDAAAGEPFSGQGTGTFTFSRTGSTTAALTANFTVSGTATSDSDYTSIGTSVTFSIGSATATKTVTVLDDLTPESSETVIVTLASGSGYTVGATSNATVTIQDDDSASPSAAYVTGTTLGTLRNDYSGWVGLRITVGGASQTVTQLGRMMAPGNTATHTVKLVKASDGLDVPGGSAAVPMSGGTPGLYKYVLLSNPVTLAANTTYYLVTQETNGGDNWYDFNTTLTTTLVAAVNGAIFGDGPGNWNQIGGANQSYGPVNFFYSVGPALPEITVTATDSLAGEPLAGQGTGTFTFSRTGSTTSPLTVNFTVSGTATSDGDYSSLGTSVTFGAGSATATKTVTALDDLSPESSETVIVTLASGSGYTMGAPSSATVTIQDDDSAETPFVIGVGLGALRNDFSGWVGMRIAVGSASQTVTQLGRMMAPGNSATHTVKLVKASDGLDVPGGSVAIPMSGGTTGQFKYTALSSPVVLSANTTYYLVSQETSGGDSWYDFNTTLATTSVALANAAIFGSGPGSWNAIGSTNQSYVPVSFIYSTGPTLPDISVAATDANAGEPLTGQGTGTLTFTRTGSTSSPLTVNFTVGGTATSGSDFTAIGTSVTFAAGFATATKTVSVLDDVAPEASESVTVTLASGSGYTIGAASSATVFIQDDDSTESSFVTGVALGALRNDYSGWVGMRIVIGGNSLVVSQLGRMMAPGNSASHNVKLVTASDGLDVPGSSIAITMSGGTSGQFKYATLSNPVTLAANTTYYLISEETAGGDSWYDANTIVTTTAAAVDDAAVWGSGPGAWNAFGGTNQAFVPLSFMYSDAPPGTAFVTGTTLGTSRNDFSGWVGMQILVGSNSLSVQQLGRMMAPGNSGTHTLKLVRASDGQDVPGGSISIPMTGGTIGQFKYVPLTTPVTLSANNVYYLLSLETGGGDAWYDWDTIVTTTGVAADTGAVYGFGSGTWVPLGGTDRSFVPVSFKY